MKVLSNLSLEKNELQNARLQNLASDPGTPVEGQLYYDSVNKRPKFHNGTAFKTVLESPASLTTEVSGTLPVANGGTGRATLTTDAILAGAGTTQVTLLTGTQNQVLRAGVGGTPAFGSLDLSAAATVGSSVLAVANGGTGAATLAANGVVLGNGTSAAQVTAAGSANQVLRVPGAGGAPAFGAIDLSAADATANQLPVGKGGTGAATFTANGSLYGNGTGAIQVTAAGTEHQVLRAGAAGVPSYGAVNLAQSAAVTGTLPVGNGGTGVASLTSNAVLLGGATIASVTIASGQVLIGTAGAPASADLTGTANRITVTPASGSITLSTPQDIHSGASPTFNDLTLNGNTLTLDADGGTDGAKIKSESGMVAIRNSADSAYGTLKCKDLIVISGTQTVLNTTEVNVGDNEIVLNGDITSDAGNTDGGVSIARLETTKAITGAVTNGGLIRLTITGHGYTTSDRVYVAAVGGVPNANNTEQNPRWTITVIDANTIDLQGSVFAGTYTSGGTSAREKNARLAWNETDTRFESRVGAASGTTSKFLAMKHQATLTSGSSSYVVTHNLNTKDVVVSIRDTSDDNQVIADVQATSVNTVTITFASNTANNMSVSIIG